jgi:hypothetical protein
MPTCAASCSMAMISTQSGVWLRPAILGGFGGMSDRSCNLFHLFISSLRARRREKDFSFAPGSGESISTSRAGLFEKTFSGSALGRPTSTSPIRLRLSGRLHVPSTQEGGTREHPHAYQAHMHHAIHPLALLRPGCLRLDATVRPQPVRLRSFHLLSL